MITLSCDNCEQTLEAPDDLAGGKLNCPHCGDVNRVPPAEGTAATPPEPRSDPLSDSGERVVDKAAAAGYPPDNGPETRVLKVRRCWFRSRPGRFVGSVIVALFSYSGLVWVLALDNPKWWLLLAVPGALASTGLLLWWWADRLSASLEITTKRTIMHTGFFKRSSSEVVHDNIRNIQVDQSFWQRVWKVGKIGISSSGQDGIEVHANHLKDPNELRRIIDLYRPL